MSLTINEFQMEKWYDHEPFTLYRGFNPSTQEKNWMKMLQSEFPTKQELQWITNEYENGQHIQLDVLMKPIRLESYNNTTILLMEHSDGHPLFQLAASGPMELKLFFAFGRRYYRHCSQAASGQVCSPESIQACDYYRSGSNDPINGPIFSCTLFRLC
ncbi:hypothetical protein [Paenibacillus sp. 32352]|uniref:hypothetical protein n=1 Tax=Paenibacillus sp. 32352 TaxID=1969111 RepID=UPI0009AE5A3A|nr:hypothetical protein [Paenibacillus sp. 32352]